MASVHEILTEQFRQWEVRGRGWRVYDEPVVPEPPFAPFDGYYLPEPPAVDDGRRPTFLSSIVRNLSQKLSTNTVQPTELPEPEAEIEPVPLVRESLVELQTSLPANLDIPHESFGHFLSSLSLCGDPIAFEVFGTAFSIVAQFATHPQDAPLVQRQLQAYFPDAAFIPTENALEKAWNEPEDAHAAVVEFGLASEFMLPLATNKLDPFVGLTGALAELEPGDLGLFQVLFQPAREPWADSVMRAVADPTGQPIFVNAPELVKAAQEKLSRPIYAAVIRIAALSGDFDRAWATVRDMAASLRVFAHPNGNELIPLANDEYPYVEHADDVIRRQSRRSGLLLNSDELIGFVHLPSSTVRSTKLKRQLVKTKAAPKVVLAPKGLLLGHNTHAGKTVSVRLSPDQRVHHTYVIGASGTGKSTLLFNLIQQDIQNGEGVAVLDPHGDLVEKILAVIPENRIGDVILVDPSDEGYSVGFNILSAHSDLEKNLLASDLVSVFERTSTSWGDQMGAVLNNAIRAFLESVVGGTLADLQRFLIEPSFRTDFLKTVRDPAVVYYWQKVFPQLSGNKSIGPVLTRLNTFLGPKPIRYMVSQKANRLDFSAIMNGRKIFLAKLAQGLLGEANTHLLGTLLVAKLQQTAMSRQQLREADRADFWLYIDEFHNFITPSMSEILTGARKYRLGLVLAHQELHQLQRSKDVSSTALSSPYTRVVFRVGDADARALESGFSHFEARDLQNLGKGEAVVRVERSDFDFNLAVSLPQAVDETLANERREQVIAESRTRYAVPRAQIEAATIQLTASERSSPPAETPTQPPRTVSERPLPKQPPAASEPPPQQPNASAVEITKPTASEQKPATPPADLGRGGEQHQAIQGRLKQAAEQLGFRATIEKSILDGQGSIDLLLERADMVIACEISIRNTVDYEVGNVRKCLKAGFPHVVVVCIEPERLRKIAAAVEGSLGSESAKHIEYLHPDEFIARLNKVVPTTTAMSAVAAPPEISHGYKIKRTYVKLPPEEERAREDAAMKAIAEAMRKKPKRGSK